jgi:hypothetical protein
VDERVSSRMHASTALLGRIASILDAAHGQVVRAVNHATVSAYWHIGQEVVKALQQGEERATYGKALIERLAQQLTERYGKGFSATNIGYFRQFYLAYRDRIPHPAGGESQRTAAPPGILHPVGGESLSMFHPNLSWSHYRALMRCCKANVRPNNRCARSTYLRILTCWSSLISPARRNFMRASSKTLSSRAFGSFCWS